MTKNGAGWPRGKLSSTAPCIALVHAVFKARSFPSSESARSLYSILQTVSFVTLSHLSSCFVLQTREQLCASRVKEQPRPGGLFSGLCKSTHLTPLLLVYLVLISTTDLVAWLGGGVGKTNHQLPNQPESFGTISRLKLPAGLSAVTPPPGCSQSA